MDQAVQDYLDAIDAAQRPLFDRIQALITEVHPEAEVRISYQMPTYVVGKRRLHVGVWEHGISLYGWDAERTADFLDRYPALRTGKGTIRLRPADLDEIGDAELRDLLQASLAP